MIIKEGNKYKLKQDEILLHENSLEHIELLKEYESTDKLPEVIKDPIIHLYAKKDTYDDEGELKGYSDSLLFECHIFDVYNNKVYKSKHHDSVKFYGINPESVKIYKDGSTLIDFFGKCKIDLLTTVCVHKAE